MAAFPLSHQPMQASGLFASDLGCRRGDRLLFADLGLALGAGEALHLVGPNGVGKTSLVMILAGLMRPWRGSVQWSGSVGLLDHRPALDPHLPLGKALAFWTALDGHGPPLERLGLADLLDVPVRYLSTGQKKRAALARLIGQAADHWLLDEPLNGLDSEGVSLVEALVAERRAGGGVVVVASHQPIDMPGARMLDLREYPA